MVLPQSAFQRKPDLSIVTANVFWHISFEELKKGIEVIVELAVGQVQYEGHWHHIKHILLRVFAPLSEVAQQVLLVGELVVELKVVQCLLEHLTFHAVFVTVPAIGLLPAKVNEHVFGVLVLHPVTAMAHHTPNESSVVARADIKLV